MDLKLASVGILALALLALSGCAGSGRQGGVQASAQLQGSLAAANASPGAQAAPNSSQPQSANGSQQAAQVLTLSEVARHNSETDCWLVISGGVYDLSSFTSHPGGMAYVPFCGTDATNAFATKGGKGSSHSSSAAAMLPNFEIGLLGQPAMPLPPQPGQANGTSYGDDGDGYEDGYDGESGDGKGEYEGGDY
ncbi:MAG: cytochrome b5-like heme/steroid binding domain-containing protein [Candidatus Micrarchaeia archaeon]